MTKKDTLVRDRRDVGAMLLVVNECVKGTIQI